MVAGLSAAIALWIAPQAGATITSTQITSPADPTYSIRDDDNPNTMAVSGTTDSTDPGTDTVDLDCFYGSGPDSSQLSADVTLQSDGSFSVPGANLENVEGKVCRLRAVPSGTPPVDLAPFAGPVLATGERSTDVIDSGPNTGAPYDLYVWGQQLTAGDDYVSAGSCGIYDGYLYDSDLTLTAVTWYCNDGFNAGDVQGDLESSTRSQLEVDGADAYTPYTAWDINDAASPGFPALTYDYTLDPATGDLTITESDEVVKCPDATYPPDETTCQSFVDTGVRLDRTITQGSDGHLVYVTDNWVSTDGKAHSLDLLPQNDQCFAEARSPCGGPDVQYKFPGETSYSTHDVGDVVPFSGSGPVAVYANVEGAGDGNTSTGQGAIVFDRPASPATFNSVSYDSEFYFHQTGTATAACPATFRFAYAQDYDSADVQSLAQSALNRFATPVTCPGPNPTTPVVPAPAGHTGKRKHALRKCKRKLKKAWKKKRAHHRLNKHAKKHLKKKFKKCKRRARKLPA
jgi:hypothetical protein